MEKSIEIQKPIKSGDYTGVATLEGLNFADSFSICVTQESNGLVDQTAGIDLDLDQAEQFCNFLSAWIDNQTPAELVRGWRDQDKPGHDADGEEV